MNKRKQDRNRLYTRRQQPRQQPAAAWVWNGRTWADATPEQEHTLLTALFRGRR
ncbi:hypothetical protein [Nonomuraea sp. PA05]|uniref:hypothetical protein n=1 Tax=Nonomuraea sp. PA05 TaxID=2604466 RepID=UPI001652B462|nr:hypothetical protein [Nonomuraea sp. PA05]